MAQPPTPGSRFGRVRARVQAALAPALVADFAFRLGEDEVIQGWNRAIPGMEIGGNRRLVVRPGLAYGSRGTAKVPPGSTLIFQVELVDTR